VTVNTPILLFGLSMLVLCTVDHRTKDYAIGICCFYA